MGKSLQKENLWDLRINWFWRRGRGKQLLRGFKSGFLSKLWGDHSILSAYPCFSEAQLVMVFIMFSQVHLNEVFTQSIQSINKEQPVITQK
jgi:hypothetical protein